MADAPANDAPFRLLDDVAFGDGVVVYSFANLYGCSIGDGSRIGPFVEIQRGAVVGARCKISSHSFICTGVEIGDEVFVGHGVVFVNDKHPRSTVENGALQPSRPGGEASGTTYVLKARGLSILDLGSGCGGFVRVPRLIRGSAPGQEVSVWVLVQARLFALRLAGRPIPE